MPTLSYESSNREPENSVYNESALGTAYDESALGTEYSIYSGDTNTNTNTNSFRGNGDRFIGTTEWARQQESQRSRFTEDTNDSSDADPWAGPGRPEDELYARADSRDYDSHGRRRQAGGRAPLHDLPQVPFKEASFKSGLSQDMNGFPELEAHAADKNSRYQTAEERDITAPHPSASSNAHHFRNLSGTGAAAAAAADAANAAAEREKEKRRLEKANAARAREESKKGPTSGSAKSTRRPKPPMPHGSASVRDTGETKEEAAAGQGSSAGGSAFHDSAIEVSRCSLALQCIFARHTLPVLGRKREAGGKQTRGIVRVVCGAGSLWCVGCEGGCCGRAWCVAFRISNARVLLWAEHGDGWHGSQSLCVFSTAASGICSSGKCDGDVVCSWRMKRRVVHLGTFIAALLCDFALVRSDARASLPTSSVHVDYRSDAFDYIFFHFLFSLSICLSAGGSHSRKYSRSRIRSRTPWIYIISFVDGHQSSCASNRKSLLPAPVVPHSCNCRNVPSTLVIPAFLSPEQGRTDSWRPFRRRSERRERRHRRVRRSD